MDNQQRDALYLANKVVTLRAELAADGRWLDMTNTQRSIIEDHVNQARRYIEHYAPDNLRVRVEAARMV